MAIALPIAMTSLFLQPRFISPSVLYDTLKVPCLISSYEAKSIVAIAIGFATALVIPGTSSPTQLPSYPPTTKADAYGRSTSEV